MVVAMTVWNRACKAWKRVMADVRREFRHNVLSAEADEFDSVGIIVQRVFAKREFHVHHKKERKGRPVTQRGGGRETGIHIQTHTQGADTHQT